MNEASAIHKAQAQNTNLIQRDMTVGQLVLTGLVVFIALSAALIWEINKPIEKNLHDPHAFSLGLAAFEKGSYNDAFQWYAIAAKQGDVKAQYALAMMHIRKQVEDADPQQSKYWLIHAAQKDFSKAQYQLGIILEKEGAAERKYLPWIEKAAKQNMSQAMLHLINLYDARNTPQDSQKALDWMLKAQVSHIDGLTNIKTSLMNHIQAQAEAGYAQSMYLLANIYRKGSIGELNKKLAYQWMLKSAQHQYLKASEAMGDMLFYGEGIQADLNQALHWYQTSNKAGSTHAKSTLGCMMLLGLGTDKNVHQGIALLRQAARVGSPSAARNLGIIAAQGFIEESNDDVAFQWFKQAADGGDITAINALGVMYALGRGVQRDIKQARKYFEKAQGNDNQAQFNLAIIEVRGLTHNTQSKHAVTWLQRAESLGNHRASFVLGLLYAKGEGAHQDTGQAIKHYERAIQQGNLDAAYNLAMLKYHGNQGLPLDAKRVHQLLWSLANQGDMDAQNMLADIELKGLSVNLNIPNAIHWYQEAAKQGYAMAQFNLGNMYRVGKGTPQNDQQAAYWYKQASQQGYAPAKNTLAYMYIHGRGVTHDVNKAKQLLEDASKELKQAEENLQHLETGRSNFSLLDSMVDSHLRGNLLAEGEMDLSQWFQMKSLPFP